MDYRELEVLGDRAREKSAAFHKECDDYGFEQAIERYRASSELFDLNEMLLIGAWRSRGSMVTKGASSNKLFNTPMPLSHAFVQDRAILFVDFLVHSQSFDENSPCILGAFCALRQERLAEYTFDVVWYLSDKRVIGGTWACEKITGKDGTTAAILSAKSLKVPNADALLFAWNAYHRAADMAFIQSSPQGRKYIQ